MWYYIRGAIFLVLSVGFYFVLPIWGIRKLCKWIKKRRQTMPRKRYKISSIPIFILNAIPGFIGCLQEQISLNFDDNILGIMMTGAWLITFIHAILQYRFAGLWIAPVRIFIGLLLGVSAGVAIILALGLILLLGLVASSDKSGLRVANNTRRVTRDGRTYEVHRLGDSEYFSDPETNDILHVVDDGHFSNQDGDFFEMWK